MYSAKTELHAQQMHPIQSRSLACSLSTLCAQELSVQLLAFSRRMCLRACFARSGKYQSRHPVHRNRTQISAENSQQEGKACSATYPRNDLKQAIVIPHEHCNPP